MDVETRRKRTADKVAYYREEVVALGEAGPGYRLGFGLLLIVLFPFLLLELLLVRVFGIDPGMFVPPQPPAPPELNESGVPERLHGLIPLALKYGIGDDADRGDVLREASRAELDELERAVGPKMSEIDAWLAQFPEGGLTDTAAYFLYLGEAWEEAHYE